jgi:hypothetical protein
MPPEAAAAIAGDNELAFLDPDIIREQLEIDEAELLNKLEANLIGFGNWLEAYGKDGIPDSSTHERTISFAGQMAKLSQLAEAKRKTRKQPYDSAAGAVQAFFKVGIIDRLDGPLRRLKDAIKTFEVREENRRREEARLAEEAARAEADRLAKIARESGSSEIMEVAANLSEKADAQAKLATGSAADLTRTYGTHGGTASLRRRWVFRVTDMGLLIKAVAEGKLPAEFLAPVDSAIRGAVQAGMRDKAEFGLEIYQDTSVGLRT